MNIFVKKLIRVLLSAMVTGVLLIAIARTQSWDSFVALFLGVHQPALFGYLAVAVISLFARTLRYHLILVDALGKCNAPGFGAMLVVTSVRNALVDMLPARLGELSFFYVLNRYGVQAASAATAFAVSIALDIVILGVLAFFGLSLAATGLALLPLAPEQFGSKAVVGGIGLAGLLCFGFVLAKLEWFAGLAAAVLKKLLPVLPAKWRQSMSNFLERIVGEVGHVRRSSYYVPLIFLTVVLRVAKYGSLYLLLLGVVHQLGLGWSDIPPMLAVGAFLVAEASASLPFSGIMGFGAYEGAWSAIFLMSEVNIPSVPSVILVVHIITQIVGYTIGLAGVMAFLIREIRS